MQAQRPSVKPLIPLFVLLVLRAIVAGGISLPSIIPGPSEGPRQVLIVRETEETNPKLAMMTTALRVGAHADYLKSKGHQLLILDDDAKNENGQPVKALEPFKPFTVPEILIVEPPSKVLARQKLPETADEVMTLLKANGG